MAPLPPSYSSFSAPYTNLLIVAVYPLQVRSTATPVPSAGSLSHAQITERLNPDSSIDDKSAEALVPVSPLPTSIVIDFAPPTHPRRSDLAPSSGGKPPHEYIDNPNNTSIIWYKRSSVPIASTCLVLYDIASLTLLLFVWTKGWIDGSLNSLIRSRARAGSSSSSGSASQNRSTPYSNAHSASGRIGAGRNTAIVGLVAAQERHSSNASRVPVDQNSSAAPEQYDNLASRMARVGVI